jgi:Sec-independent protein translocase protein TatA
MGKAIRNFKDALAGVEEANFRKLGEAESKKDTPSTTQASTSSAESTSSSGSDQKPS